MKKLFYIIFILCAYNTVICSEHEDVWIDPWSWSNQTNFELFSPQGQQKLFQKKVVESTLAKAIEECERLSKKFNADADKWVNTYYNNRRYGISTDQIGKEINFRRELAREYAQAANDLQSFGRSSDIILGSYSQSTVNHILREKIQEFEKFYERKSEELAQLGKSNQQFQRLAKITDYSLVPISTPLFSPLEQPSTYVQQSKETKTIGSWQQAWENFKQKVRDFFSIETPSFEKPMVWQAIKAHRPTIKMPRYHAPTWQKTRQRTQKLQTQEYIPLTPKSDDSWQKALERQEQFGLTR